MDPLFLTNLVNVLFLFLMVAVPVVIIAYGVSIGWRLARRETLDSRNGAFGKVGRVIVAVAVIVVGLLWLFLSFNMQARAGQSPQLVILPVLLILFAQIAFWVLIIAGAVWLVLWLARRIGVVGPPRETPLDILKARYARGELSTEQFEEMKRRLGDA